MSKAFSRSTQFCARCVGPRGLVWLLIGALFLCMIGPGCSKKAKDASDQQQKALDTLKGRSWYDSEKLAYRPPKVSQEFDSEIRRNGWEAAPATPKPAPAPAAGGWGWWSGFEFSTVVWIVLGAGLLILALPWRCPR